MAGVPISRNMFDQYVNSARMLMAELSKIVGDSYDPGDDYELTNTIHRAQAVSMSVLTMIQSLHASHPPMVALPVGVTPASQVTGIPPAEAPPGTPLQAEQPPASV